MKTYIAYLIVFSSLLFASSTVSILNDGGVQDAITSAAIWKPSQVTMQRIGKDCGNLSGNELQNCFLKVMELSGASEQAINFTKKMGLKAYMTGFRKLGKIDAAYIYRPLGSGNRDGCVLVNGKPEIIDVDDYSLFPVESLVKDSVYRELLGEYKHIQVFPAERNGTEYPSAEKLAGNIERIRINYGLRNGCSTCTLVGFAVAGFDFDSTGKYIGTSLVSVKKAINEDKMPVVSGNPENYYSDPSKTIVVSTGKKFVIALISNHSEGYKWQIADTLNTAVLSLSGNNYLKPYETLPNAAGKELWYFNALGQGSAVIEFKYVASWNNNSAAGKTVFFTVEVK